MTRVFIVFAALLALVLTAGVTTSEASPRPVTGGYLEWGVKESFRDYIEGPIGQGAITVSGGTTKDGDTFHFPVVSGTYDGNSDTFVQFTGTVRFVAHEGLLDFTINDLKIDFSGSTGVVIGDMLSRRLSDGQFVSYPNIDIVDMTLTGYPPNELTNSVSWSPIPSFLTEEAEPAFEGFYDPGEEFDPVEPHLNLQNCGTTDTDGDTVGDPCDTCPNWPNPSQAKPSWALASSDPDCDGYSTTDESRLGTTSTDACGFTSGGAPQSSTWPPDLVESNSINISDVLALKPIFNTTVPPTSVRYDLVASNSINISDVLALKPIFNQVCTESGP